MNMLTKEPRQRPRQHTDEATQAANPPNHEQELARLVTEIKDDLRKGRAAAEEKLRRYRSAGEGLLRAKELVGHGRWGAWLKEHCALSERQAQKYMAYAKSALKADLEAEERLWASISGNGADQSKGQPRRPGGGGGGRPTTKATPNGTGNKDQHDQAEEGVKAPTQPPADDPADQGPASPVSEEGQHETVTPPAGNPLTPTDFNTLPTLNGTPPQPPAEERRVDITITTSPSRKARLQAALRQVLMARGDDNQWRAVYAALRWYGWSVRVSKRNKEARHRG